MDFKLIFYILRFTITYKILTEKSPRPHGERRTDFRFNIHDYHESILLNIFSNNFGLIIELTY